MRVVSINMFQNELLNEVASLFLCHICVQNSPLCRGPFPPGVGPVLSQIQRAQLLNSQVTPHTHAHKFGHRYYLEKKITIMTPIEKCGFLRATETQSTQTELNTKNLQKLYST